MLKDVVSVIPSDPYRLQIRFEDGVEGIVALNDLVPFEGVFAPELGVVYWPNGADLDSDVLYTRIAASSVGRKIVESR
jgi:hypothetical protein